MAPRPLRALSAAALAIIAALALTWATATAQEPITTATGTTLHPGANLIGWVGETAPVSQLFRDIPQLEAVWAWDAELDGWIVAGRNVPEGLGWLWQVSPGMGLYMVLNGDQPFLWNRSTEPTRGLVELRTGWNLVAWSGANETPINDATKGIGWSLREVRRHNAETQQWTIWTSAERTAQLIATSATDQGEETPTIQRGEALWINVARAVRWLQPTDILPRLVFPGGASDELQARVREDLESVLAFFRIHYSTQADPDFTVYIPKDVDSLIQIQKDEGKEIDDAEAASIRSLWDKSAGWAGDKIVVKQSSWPEDPSASGIAHARYHLTHEYLHIIQRQLPGMISADWLVEGTADWGDGEHQVLDGQRTLQDLRDGLLSSLSSHTPALHSTESDNNLWEYTLGWLATDQLTADVGSDSWLELWRRTSALHWQDAFEDVFNLPVSDFYNDFDVWQRQTAAANAATTSVDEDDARWIHGRITNERGASVAGVLVNAIRVEGETGVGWNQRAETRADGSFTVRAPEDGDYRISVNVRDDCIRYYSGGGLIDELDEAQLATVAGSDLRSLSIRLQPDVCGWQLKGSVTRADGSPLSNTYISACREVDDDCAEWIGRDTDADGSFAITVPADGRYHISFNLDGCTIYFRAGGFTTSWDERGTARINGGDARLAHRQIPEGMCASRISGNIAIAAGQPLANTSIRVCREVDGRCVYWTGVGTNQGGSFSITVPTGGRYRVWLNLEGCTIYFGTGGLTTRVEDRLIAQVADTEVRLNPRQISQDVCALWQISGSITTADGQPLANAYVSACHETDDDPCVGRRTDNDGSFSIIVPKEGVYSLNFEFNGCTLYFRTGGFTTNQERRGTARVEGRNVRLGPRQIPQSLCPLRRISGSIATSDSQPLAGTWVSACRETNDGTCAGGRTESDGSFSITVPEAGAYRLWFGLDGCSSLVYFSADSLTTTRQNRLIARVADREVRLNARHIPANVCPRIIGSVARSDERPIASIEIEACREVSGRCVEQIKRRPGYDGSFAIAAPAAGSYRLSYNFDGCELHYGSTGLTSNTAEATRFDAGAGDLQIGHRQVSDSVCAHQISGTLVGDDDASLDQTRVTACEWVNDECASRAYGQVDDDGHFAVTVPVDGAYQLILELSRCSVYFGQEELASNRSDAWLFRVAGQGVSVPQYQVPIGLCDQQVNIQQISGQLVDADGEPLADTWVSTCREVGCRHLWGEITDVDGSFSITVPEEGAYQLWFWLDDCQIRFSIDSLTTDRDQQLIARIADRDLHLAPRQVPAGMCAHVISGRFVDANGAPLAERWFNIWDSDRTNRGGFTTDANGHFEMHVPSDGSYYFGTELRREPYCWHRFEGQTGGQENPIHVSGADVTGITLRLPGTIEELCN